MAITYEPSVADQLAPAIDTFAKGLDRLLKPNHEFQIAMQKAVGNNPQLAQSLADLEYNAPGSLKNLGFGALGDVLSQLPESPEASFRRKNRGEILGNEKNKLDLEGLQTGVSIDGINEFIHYAKDQAAKGQPIMQDVAMARLGIGTPLERAGQAGRARQEAAAATKSEAELPGQLAKIEADKKQYDDAIKAFPALEHTDFFQLARDAIRGKSGSSQLAAAALSLPGTKETMNHAFEFVKQQQIDAFREYLSSQTGTKTADKSLTQQAFQMYKQTGAGTLPAWKVVIDTPEQVEEIKKKAPADLTQDDKDILDAASAHDEIQQRLKVRDVAGQTKDIAEAAAVIGNHMDRVNAGTASFDNGVVQAQLSRMNTQFQAQGKEVTAKFGERPKIGDSIPASKVLGVFGGEGKGLYYVDKSGKRIDDADAINPSKPSLTGDALRAFTQLMSKSPKERQTSLDALKSANPSLYNTVLPFIK